MTTKCGRKFKPHKMAKDAAYAHVRDSFKHKLLELFATYHRIIRRVFILDKSDGICQFGMTMAELIWVSKSE